MEEVLEMALISRYNPFRGLREYSPMPDVFDLEREFDRLMNRTFGELFTLPEPWSLGDLFRTRLTLGTELIPKMDTLQKGDDVVLRLELPGVNKADISIELEGNRLVVSAKHEEAHEKKEEGYLSRETYSGEYRRSVGLPEGINEDHIQANYVDGVLEVTVQGAAQVIEGETKKIPVEGKKEGLKAA